MTLQAPSGSLERSLVIAALASLLACAEPSPRNPARGQATPPLQPSSTAGLPHELSSPFPSGTSSGLPVTTPTSSAASLPPRRSTMSPSCAPAQLSPVPPKPAARTVVGLAQLFDDPEATWADIQRDFGAGRPSKHTSESRDLLQPIVGTSWASVAYRHVQNHEYLTTLEIAFPKKTRPTAGELARKLGLLSQLSRQPIRSACSHQPCPSVIVYRGPVMTSQRVIFSLESAARAALGQRRAASFGVTKLHFDNVRGGCRSGAALSEPVALVTPSAGRPQQLVAAMLAVAVELKNNAHDEQLIKAALDDFGQVQIRHNSMSRFTWVRLFPDKKSPIEPICFEGFRYVTAKARMCQIVSHQRHLYETDGNATHRIFLMVQLAGPYGKPPDHITHTELTRMPRGWKDMVF